MRWFFFRLTAGLAAIFLLLGVAVYFFGNVLLAPLLKARLIAEADRRLGVELSIEELQVEFFDHLIVRGIVVAPPAASPLARPVRIGQVRVDYRLPLLRRGLKAFAAGAEVRIDRIELRLDAGAVESPAGPEPRPAGWLPVPLPFSMPWLDFLPAVEVREALVEFKSNGTRLQGSGLYLILAAASADLAGRTIDFGAQETSLDHPRLAEPRRIVEPRGSLRLEPQRLILDSLVMAGREVRATTVVEIAPAGPDTPAGLVLTSSASLFGGELDAEVQVNPETIHGRLTLEEVDLGELYRGLALSGPEPRGRVGGTIVMELPAGDLAALTAETSLVWNGAGYDTMHLDRLTLRGTVEQGEPRVEEMTASVGANRLTLSRVTLPGLADLDFADLGKMAAESSLFFSAELEELPVLLAALGFASESERIGVIPPHAVHLAGSIDRSLLSLESGFLRTEEGSIEIERLAYGPLAPDGWRRAPLRLDALVDLPHLDRTAALLNLAGWRGSLAAKVAVSGTLEAPEGTLVARGEAIGFREFEIASLSLKATAAAGLINLEEITVREGENHLSAAGVLVPESRTIQRLAIDVDLTEPGSLAGPLHPALERLDGPVKGRVVLSGPWSGPLAVFEVGMEEGAYDDIEIRRLTLQGDWRENKIRVQSLRAETSQGNLELETIVTLPSAPDMVLTIAIDRLHGDRDGREVQLLEPVTVLLGPGKSLTLPTAMRLRVADGSLMIVGGLDEPGEQRLSITASHLDSRSWLPAEPARPFYFHDLGLDILIAGPSGSPDITFSGTVPQLGTIPVDDSPAGYSLPGYSLAGSFAGAVARDGIRLERFQWTGDHGLAIDLQGFLPVALLPERKLLAGDLVLEGSMRIPELPDLSALLPGMPAGGKVEMAASLQGTWQRPAGRLTLHAVGLQLPAALQPGPAGPFDLRIDLSGTREGIRFDTLELRGADLTLTGSGDWRQPSWRAAAEGETDFRQRLGGRVQGEAAIALANLAWLADRYEAVQRVSGSLTAEVTVSGTPAEPLFAGTLHYTGGEARLSRDLPLFRNLDLRAELTPKRLEVVEAGGDIGGAPFRFTGALWRNQGDRYEVDAHFSGRNLLFYRSEGLKIRANADLQASGPVSSLMIEGAIEITDGAYTRQFDLFRAIRGEARPTPTAGLQLFSFTDAPLRDARLAIRISALSPFTIRNNLVNGSFRPDLHLGGTGELPLLTGTIYLDPTTMRLPAGRFRTTSGLVRFLEKDPDRPLLDIVAESTMLGYDVDAVVQGPYDAPVVSLSSIPPLPEDELVLLVLTGKPPASGSFLQAGGYKQGTKMAVYLGRDFLTRLLGISYDDESILERLDVQFGRAITRRGDETFEASLLMGEDLLGWEEDLYLTTEKDVHDAINAGVKIVFQFK